jgi:glycerophosphoryl diester phosphodiesterase
VARRENTIDAFVEARRAGADGVELDVRRGVGGALVVHHDAALPDGRTILNLGIGDLPPEVPLLDAALDACEGMLVNVEVKNLPFEADFDADELVAGLVAAAAVERRASTRVLVSSFSLASIDAVRAAEPTVATGWLTPVQYDQRRALATTIEHGHGALHPHHGAVTAELVAAAHDAGVAVHTWTVDDPARMVELADMGVDSVITNVPDVAVATLAAYR